MSKRVRLHPATPGGREIHRVRWRCQDDARVAWTACGIKFAYGDIPPAPGRLPRCGGCWS